MAYCWYASYGSNLLAERLITYLVGGVPPLGTKAEVGARDPSPPTADRALMLPYQLYFAHQSKRWDGKGICFLDHNRSKSALTYSRAWRITDEQFVDIVRQENNKPEIDFDPAAVFAEPTTVVGKGLYSRVVVCDHIDGEPVVTCTGVKGVDQQRSNSPAAGYLTIVAAGLHQTTGLNRQGMKKYFEKLPGIRGQWSGQRFNQLLDEAIDMARYLTASGEMDDDLAAGYEIDESEPPDDAEPN